MVPSEPLGKDQEERPEPAVAHVTATDLIDGYKANEVAADPRYQGQSVEVAGVAERVGKDILGKPYMILRSDRQFEFRSVQCYCRPNWDLASAMGKSFPHSRQAPARLENR
jgi:hypothetical protein